MSSTGPYRLAADPVPDVPAPAPPVYVPVLTAERMAEVMAIIRARHPWLAAASVVLEVDGYQSQITASVTHAGRMGSFERATLYVYHQTTLGALDEWVASLWSLLRLDYQHLGI